MVEQLIRNQQVVSSNLTVGSKRLKGRVSLWAAPLLNGSVYIIEGGSLVRSNALLYAPCEDGRHSIESFLPC